jgi:dTMP kinase
VPGRFIVFEGVEGCGKTTQARLLGEWLESRRIPHVLTREPGGTVVGEGVRPLILHGEHIHERTELLLYLSARAALITEVVRPALETGQVVVADRYEMSTFAYQAHGRGLPLERVRAINDFATGGLKPDLTLLFEVPDDVAGRRLHGRGGPDRIERAGPAFHDRVGAAYRELAKTEPAVEAVDGSLEPAVVHERVVHILQSRFPETFANSPG